MKWKEYSVIGNWRVRNGCLWELFPSIEKAVPHVMDLLIETRLNYIKFVNHSTVLLGKELIFMLHSIRAELSEAEVAAGWSFVIYRTYFSYYGEMGGNVKYCYEQNYFRVRHK